MEDLPLFNAKASITTMIILRCLAGKTFMLETNHSDPRDNWTSWQTQTHNTACRTNGTRCAAVQPRLSSEALKVEADHPPKCLAL